MIVFLSGFVWQTKIKSGLVGFPFVFLSLCFSSLNILELWPHLQIPALEQEVTATRNPSVVDTRR